MTFFILTIFNKYWILVAYKRSVQPYIIGTLKLSNLRHIFESLPLILFDTFSSQLPLTLFVLQRNRKITETMSRSELRNDDQQQPTIIPASIDKGESPVADMSFSPTPPFVDQQQPPLPQPPTITATTINSGESHVATTLTAVPSSSIPPLSSVSADTSKKRRGRPIGSRNKIQSKRRASGNSLFLFPYFFYRVCSKPSLLELFFLSSLYIKLSKIKNLVTLCFFPLKLLLYFTMISQVFSFESEI